MRSNDGPRRSLSMQKAHREMCCSHRGFGLDKAGRLWTPASCAAEESNPDSAFTVAGTSDIGQASEINSAMLLNRLLSCRCMLEQTEQPPRASRCLAMPLRQLRRPCYANEPPNLFIYAGLHYRVIPRKHIQCPSCALLVRSISGLAAPKLASSLLKKSSRRMPLRSHMLLKIPPWS